MINSKMLDNDTMTKLTNLKKRLKKNNNHTIKFIAKEKINKTKGVGRLYPSHNNPSLQDMPRNVRKALCYDKYTDLDVVNCHPVILMQVFKEHDIGCDSLGKYVINRESCLQETGKSREEAKMSFIRLMYGGKPHKDDNAFMVRFYEDFSVASRKLLNTAQYNLYLKLGELRKPTNPLGHAMSILAQDKERQVVSQIISTFQDNDYETSTLIHDGFHIKSLNVDNEHIQEAKQNVKQITNYDIDITIKPMNDFEPTELWDDDIEELGEAGDHESAKMFLEWAEENGHHFVKCKKQVFWYNPDVGIWNDDLNDLRHLINECTEISWDYRQMAKHKDALIKELKVTRDDKFIFNAKDTTFLKLAFKNGIWDFEKGKLVPFSHEYTFFCKAPINYKHVKNDEVFQKLFVDVFGNDKARYILKCFSRAMAGQIYDKSFFNIIGESNSGKGCLSDMLTAAFGDFIGTINSGVFKCVRSNGDEAKARSWMCPIKDSRMIISNEIKMDQELDGSIIKTLSSGGDGITARQNFQNESTFVMQGTCFLFMNDMPKIKDCGEATSNRLRYVSTEYSYLEYDEYERHKKSSYVRKADTTIKTHFIKKMENVQAFAHLVLTSYCRDKPVCPETVKNENAEWTGKDDIKTQMQELITPSNATDKISLKVLMSACKHSGLEVSVVRVGKIMRGWGYEIKDCKIDGKTQKCVFGVELNNNDEQDLQFKNDGDY
tara:strand:+ start:2501 stop:4654 length:2154 start_codon:yes stop_codon:yes gene_type:complete